LILSGYEGPKLSVVTIATAILPMQGMLIFGFNILNTFVCKKFIQCIHHPRAEPENISHFKKKLLCYAKNVDTESCK